MKRIIFLLLAFFVLTGAAGAEIKVEHQLGTVSLSPNPERVVVFDYGILDALDALGVQVAGVVKSSLPPYLEKFKASQYLDVGTLFEPNLELIYELAPQAIFISTRQMEQFAALNRIAPTVFLDLDTQDYWGSFSANLRVLAEIFDKGEDVERILAELAKAQEEVGQKAQASGLRALIIMANDGALSVYGPNSRFGVIHQSFGFLPADPQIELANHGQNVSFEYLVQTDPDLMLVIDRAAIAGGSVSARQVMDNLLVKMTSAYQNERLFYLNSQIWYVAAGGITATEMMIQDLERIFSKD